MIRTPSKFVLCFSLFSLFLLISSNSFGDGKYFPEKVYKTAPNIPGQRAVLVYKDGIEKLIIESSLEAEGKEFGWVIPVPAKPTEFKKVSHGFLETLDLILQPHLIHELGFGYDLLIIAFIITLWFFLVLIFRPRSSITKILLTFLLLFICLSLMMPTMGLVPGGPVLISGIEIVEQQEVGSYNLFVLEVEEADALNSWLDSNGFVGLSTDEIEVVSDYCRDGWFFVAARLKRTAGGYSKPHPLMLAFETRKPVYPMRLTGFTNNPMYLKLFVISDKNAVCSPLDFEVYNKFSRDDKAWRYKSKYHAGFSGSFNQMIGHPDCAEYLWDGCVLSKLCGQLQVEQMNQDFYLEFKDDKPARRHYFTQQGKKNAVAFISFCGWTASLIFLCVRRMKKIYQKGGRVYGLVHIAFPSLVLAVIAGLIPYFMIPTVDVQIGGKSGKIWDVISQTKLTSDMMDFGLVIFGEDASGMDVESAAEILKNLDKFKNEKNVYTDQGLKLEDSPGNYTVGSDERGIFIRTYNSSGFPMDLTDEYFKKQSEDN